MTQTERFLPKPIVFLMPPGGQLIGLVGALEVFDAANRIRASVGAPPAYSLTFAGVGDTTSSAAGPSMRTVPVDDVDAVHTLVIGGGLDLADRPASAAVLRAATRLTDRAERVVSICAGAFVLGDLGLLDGRRCTSHWLTLEALRTRFPSAVVEPDALFVHDGVYSSAGATAGIDLALHLVRRDLGVRLARQVARVLVVFAQRPGGQSQFSTALRVRAGVDDRLRALVDTIHAELGGDHRVEVLARRVGMSTRNFARVFRSQIGSSPAAFVGELRIEAAKNALAESDAAIAVVASDCGFGTEQSLRRAFVRSVGISPGAYRKRFS